MLLRRQYRFRADAGQPEHNAGAGKDGFRPDVIRGLGE